MSTYVNPGDTYRVTFTDAPTGLTGTFGWQLLSGTTVVQARVTTGVAESPAGSGCYVVTATAPSTTGQYRLLADTGTITPSTVSEEEIIVSYTRPTVPATSGPSYSTPDAVRAVLGVNSTTLPDATADILIQDAEDWIDNLLGGWLPDDTTGRKILEDDVDTWQWAKLTRAATKTAAALYTTPGLLTRRLYRKESGPDFAVEDPKGGGELAPAIALLNASGLRRLTGRATTRTHTGTLNPNLSFAYNLPDPDDLY